MRLETSFLPQHQQHQHQGPRRISGPGFLFNSFFFITRLETFLGPCSPFYSSFSFRFRKGPRCVSALFSTFFSFFLSSSPGPKCVLGLGSFFLSFHLHKARDAFISIKPKMRSSPGLRRVSGLGFSFSLSFSSPQGPRRVLGFVFFLFPILRMGSKQRQVWFQPRYVFILFYIFI